MADITLKTNQDAVLRLKACGLSNAEINKIINALTPQIKNKAESDLSNVENETFKAKAEEAGISGGGSTEIFIVNATDAVPFPGEPGYVELDKTYDEIMEAYNANKIVYVKGDVFTGVNLIPLVRARDRNSIVFRHYDGMYLREIIWRKREEAPVYYEEEYMIDEFVEDYVVETTFDGTQETVTLDRTFKKILTAYNEGKNVKLKVDVAGIYTVIAPLTEICDSFVRFATVDQTTTYSLYLSSSAIDGDTAEINVVTLANVDRIPSEDFKVTLTWAEDGTTITADKSFDEIVAAHEAGSRVYCYGSLDGIAYGILPLSLISLEDGALFEVNDYRIIIRSDGSIELSDIEPVRSQDVATDFDEYAVQTDYLIPTTKAVADYVKGRIADHLPSVHEWPFDEFVVGLMHNSLTPCTNPLTALKFLLPPTSNIEDYHESSISFTSSETGTVIAIEPSSDEPPLEFIFVGDDCYEDGTFVPEPNTRYEVSIKRLGDVFVARVGAY